LTVHWLILISAAVLLAVLGIWLWPRIMKTRILVAAYGDAQEKMILNELVRDFNKKQSHVQASTQWFPYDVFTREVQKAVQRGVGPDVVVLDAAHYPDFVFDGFLEPLNTSFMTDMLDIDDFYPQVVGRFYQDGYLYAVPRDAAPICLVYYNKRAFDEAGVPYPRDDWDWNKFVETAKRVMKVDASGRVECWGFIEGWSMMEGWVYDAGGSYVDDIKCPTRWTLAEDRDSLKGLEFRRDLIHKHKVMPPPDVWSGVNDTDSMEMFVAGKAAMVLWGLWKTPRFREIRDFQWDVALIPRTPLGHLDFSMVGSGYGIPSGSKFKDAAWRFVKYASGEEGSKKLAVDGLSQPARMKIANSEVFLDQKDPRNKKIVLGVMKHGKYSPICRNWSEVKAIIERGFGPVWEGKITVEEALERLKPILEKNPPVTQ
jgi:ABC-type glycerol-3-phosphate transport system substrate-binding protein